MADNKNIHIPLGSGKLYAVAFTAGAIPEDSVIETDANLMGGIEKGAECEYKPTVKEFKDDLGIYVRDAVTAEEATLKASMIAWSSFDFKKFAPTARVDEATKPGHRVVKIGGLGNVDNTLYLFRFVHKDAQYGDVRLTVVGTQSGGFKLGFKSDDSGNMDVEVKAQPSDGEGTLIIYDETLPHTQLEKVSGLTVTTAAGIQSGKVKLTVTPTLTSGSTYKIKLDAGDDVHVDDDVSSWSMWDGTAEVTAASGQTVTVVEAVNNLATKGGTSAKIS